MSVFSSALLLLPACVAVACVTLFERSVIGMLQRRSLSAAQLVGARYAFFGASAQTTSGFSELARRSPTPLS